MKEILGKEINEALGDNMVEYGITTWRRFIPSNIDGLKPVQRRILYTAYLNNTGKFIKNSNLLGKSTDFVDTGDAGIYGALVFMGQYDRHIHPLLEPQGNFGFITDSLSNYAASRYTESRISQYALDFYFTPDFKYTDWKPNYTGTTTEPSVLPTLLPMGLVQGSEALAYTNSNSMLPLELKSVAKSYIEFLKLVQANKSISSKEEKRLYSYLQFGLANDCKIDAVSENLFKEGKGSVKMIGEYHLETGDYGRNKIVITKLPYLTEVSSFMEKIASWNPDIIQHIANIQDESSGEGIRITITVKKSSPIEIVTDFLTMNLGFGSKGSGFRATKGITMKYFSHKEWVVEEYNVLKIFREHYAFKTSVLHKYFTALIEEYEKKLMYLEALLWIISDKKRVDQFINTVRSSSKDNLGDNLHSVFKNISVEILLYIADKKFTVMLKDAEDIKNQIADLKDKLKTAKHNINNKIEYLINEIENKVKKY